MPVSPVVDVTGDVCPMTFVKVKMALAGLPPAATLSVRLKEQALKDVVASLKAEGHRVLGVGRDGEVFVLEVEKQALGKMTGDFPGETQGPVNVRGG